MNHPFSLSAPAIARPALLLGLVLLLSACETPINKMRAGRFGQSPQPIAATVEPRAMALALQADGEGRGLTPQSLQQANQLLASQGRIAGQVLTLTPFNARGQQLAGRLSAALVRSGARKPTIAPLPAEAERLTEAAANGWDLELQSEALVVNTETCAIADSGRWAVHPYYGVGELGCANRANVARMASDPRDLQRPRTLDAADGAAAALAVQRYQTGEIRELIDIDFDD